MKEGDNMEDFIVCLLCLVAGIVIGHGWTIDKIEERR